MITKFYRSQLIFAVPLLLLAIPFTAMFFTKEVQWTLSDFVIAAILLFGAAGIVYFFLKKFKSTRQKLIAVALTLLVLIVIWAELAVGIFGSPLAGS